MNSRYSPFVTSRFASRALRATRGAAAARCRTRTRSGRRRSPRTRPARSETRAAPCRARAAASRVRDRRHRACSRTRPASRPSAAAPDAAPRGSGRARRGGELGIVGARREEVEHSLVDTGTIIMNLRNGRPAQVAALGARVHGADRVVVRVEDPLIAIVDGVSSRVGARRARTARRTTSCVPSATSSGSLPRTAARPGPRRPAEPRARPSPSRTAR